MFDDLKSHLLGLTSVIAGAIALIVGLHAKLEAAIAADADSGSQDAVTDLLNQIDQAKTDLATAITANTPTDPSGTGAGVVMPTPPQQDGTQPWIDPNAPAGTPAPVGSSDVPATPPVEDAPAQPPVLGDGTVATDPPAQVPDSPVTPPAGMTSGEPTT